MEISEQPKERINNWTVKMQDECLAYTDEYCAKHPEHDRRMVRESFIFQKIAGALVVMENMAYDLQKLHRR